MLIEITINGEARQFDVDARVRLSDLLREKLALTGTKVSCGEGACGSCAVLMDSKAVNSCLLLAAAVDGHSVMTIEGIAGDTLSRLQRAFIEEDALQCGFCTPGQIVTATALLTKMPNPSRAKVRSEMAGNLCRCGTYPRIEAAILRAALETNATSD
jgi:aerobic-type carbon monoxide dehydrogenase small subunit (CoxS/CutS family)